MPIILEPERKNKLSKIILCIIYGLLSIGAVTMVYPFLLMVSISLTNEVDVVEYKLIPKYLFNHEVLGVKYLAERFSDISGRSSIEEINYAYGANYAQMKEIKSLPRFDLKSKGVKKAVSDWDEFKKELPAYYTHLNFQGGELSWAHRRYIEFQRKNFHGDIRLYNQKYLEQAKSFSRQSIFLLSEHYEVRDWSPDVTTPEAKLVYENWIRFKKGLAPEFQKVVICRNLYQGYLARKYENKIDLLNQAWDTRYKNFYEIKLSERIPENPKELTDWSDFVRVKIPIRYLVIDEADKKYQDYLKQTYGSIDRLNHKWLEDCNSFEEIRFPLEIPKVSAQKAELLYFLKDVIPLSDIKITGSEHLYIRFLQKRYKTIFLLNEEYGTMYKDFSEVKEPEPQAIYTEFVTMKDKLRWEFVRGNYTAIMDFILLNGRAVTNTVIFCLAMVLTSITINPLCAYALSRFRLSYGNKVLLFILATMAFPAEVTMIPNFLLLKEFHLLNTYWALILPGMVNGFSIFLLKGFFDSLPEELFEAGIMDGASELMMLRKIAMPLSKPIFAVIALGAFTAAYGSFMWAFLVVQDPKMWTLMVYLYQLQQQANISQTMAGLTIASIPTFLIFLFCQKIILKGIIIPSFK